MSKPTLILNQQQILQKVRRIAYQIVEDHMNEEQLVIAGIANSGYAFAQKLTDVLKEIHAVDILLGEIQINKQHPLDEIICSLKPEDYAGKSVIIVDDVLNSGATLIYAVKYFLDQPLKQLKTAVLVDRSHKKFPVKADYKGISLSTSLNEMVQVHFGEIEKVELY